MRLLTLLLALITLVKFVPLSAEVEEVVVHWDPKTCSKEQCVQQLERALKNISGAAAFALDLNAGQVTFRWKPRSRFFLQDINNALRAANVKPTGFFVTVRGTVSHLGKKVTLESIGDNTSFELYSPLQGTPKNPRATPSIDQFALDPNLLKKFQDSETGFYTVRVSGALLMPERSPPNRIIVQNVQGGAPDQSPAPVKNNPGSSLGDRLRERRDSRINQNNIPQQNNLYNNPPSQVPQH